MKPLLGRHTLWQLGLLILLAMTMAGCAKTAEDVREGALEKLTAYQQYSDTDLCKILSDAEGFKLQEEEKAAILISLQRRKYQGDMLRPVASSLTDHTGVVVEAARLLRDRGLLPIPVYFSGDCVGKDCKKLDRLPESIIFTRGGKGALRVSVSTGTTTSRTISYQVAIPRHCKDSRGRIYQCGTDYETRYETTYYTPYSVSAGGCSTSGTLVDGGNESVRVMIFRKLGKCLVFNKLKKQ